MLNYIKSELYRITRSKEVYIFTGVLAGLTLLFNCVTFLLMHKEKSFPYGTVSFSLSNLSGNMLILCFAGAAIVIMLLEGAQKKGTDRNTVAIGISREKMVFGKWVVCVAASLCSMIVILSVFIGSAVIFFESGIEPNAVFKLCKGIVCVLPIAIAFELLAVVLLFGIGNDMLAGVWWVVIVYMIPRILGVVGMKYEGVEKIARWLPANFLTNMYESRINMKGWICMWDTPEGVAKCLISGVVSMVVFCIAGLLLCKKKNV